ncbi:MAG TPA: NUDIX domain-containing protein [Candidatus Paceibacterota bacterium]
MDPAQRFKVVPAVYLMLIKDGQILLSRRFQTGYEDGNYSLPAGHLDGGETLTEALVREVKEEIDVVIKKEDIELKHTMNRKASDHERIDFFFTVRNWRGEPKIMEPNKCDDLKWFPLNNLPANIIPCVRFAIESVLSDKPYSEYGW